jgi:hypothetical protein
MEKPELRPINRHTGWIGPAIVILFLLTGCYYDNEETLYPQTGSGCDLTNVTYSAAVKPVLQSYCLSCHSTAAAPGSGNNIRLENLTDLKTYVTNGKLYGAVSQAAGYSPMPKGGGKLDNCTLQKIKKWMDDGALNN